MGLAGQGVNDGCAARNQSSAARFAAHKAHFAEHGVAHIRVNAEGLAGHIMADNIHPPAIVLLNLVRLLALPSSPFAIFIFLSLPNLLQLLLRFFIISSLF